MIAYIAAFCIITGCFFMFIAGLGVFRLPDIYMRLHASTKATSLGAGLLLIAAIIKIGNLATVTQSIIIIAFIFLTAPVGAHMLGRAAYFRKIPQWDRSITDEAKDMVDVKRHRLGTPDRFAGSKPRPQHRNKRPRRSRRPSGENGN